MFLPNSLFFLKYKPAVRKVGLVERCKWKMFLPLRM